MKENKLAQIQDNTVVQIIVCNSIQWAEEKLGGTWIDVTETQCGIGWTYENGQFIPPYSEHSGEDE